MSRVGCSGKFLPVRKFVGAVFLLSFFALLLVPRFISNKAVAIPVKSHINGFYAVYVQHGDNWVSAGKIGFDRFFNENQLDLSSFLKPDEPSRVRIVQSGGGAAHIDSVFINGFAPSSVKGAEGPFVLDKLSRSDFDVIEGFGKSIDLEFPAVNSTALLSLTARVEPARISKRPFLFPVGNLYKGIDDSSSFYSYALKGSHGYEVEPFFKEFSLSGSGHPSGWTYGWVRNDGDNLYVKIDFTPDNTMDGNKDYSKVFIKTADGIKEFKVAENETDWGIPHFTYTDKVAYQHKLYDFRIPLSELGAMGEEEILIAFAAYGTAAPPASIFYVDGTNGNDTTGDGLSWATAKATIGAALTLSNTAIKPASVCVAAGSYTTVGALQPRLNVALVGTGASAITSPTAETQASLCVDTSGFTGDGTGISLLNGGHSNLGVVHYSSSTGSGQNSILEGFEITNTSGGGAGVKILNSSPTVRDNTVTGNPFEGIYISAAAGRTASPIISGNTITSNTRDGIFALANSSRSNTTSTVSPVITNNMIGGLGAGNSGRGIFIKAFAYASGSSPAHAVASPTISGNVITGNTKEGIYMLAYARQTSSGPAIGTVSGTVSNNTVSSNSLAGIYVKAYASSNGNATASPTINNNTISSNTDNGIYVRAYARSASGNATASPTINNNTITANTLSGVLISAALRSSSSNLAIASPTLSENTITGNTRDGIAIFVSNTANTVNNIANPDLGTTASGTGRNSIKGNNTGGPSGGVTFADVRNQGGGSLISAQDNWWAVTPPTTAEIIPGAAGVTSSPANAQALSFTVSPSSGAAGDTVHITALANSFFVAKAGASIDSNMLPIDNNISVTIGGATATNIVVAAGGASMTVTAPSGTAGAQDVVVTNPAGQTGTVAGGFTYPDTTAPTSPSVVIDSGAANTNSTAVTLALSANDNIGVTGYFVSESSTTPTAVQFTAATSTPTFSANVAFTLSTGDGTKTVNAWFIDAASNITGLTSDTIILDQTAPVAPTIGAPTTGAVVNSTASIPITGTAEAGATVTVKDGTATLGTATAAGDGSWTLASGTLTEAVHSFTATQTDAAGNTGPASAAVSLTVSLVTVDVTPPSAPVISSPADGATVSTSTPTITGTAEAGSTVELFDGVTSIGSGTADSAGAWSITAATLSENSHSITATATDAAGNTSSASAAVNIAVSVSGFTSSVINIVFPQDGATDIDLSTAFIWKKATASDGSAVTYSITYCTDAALTTGCASVVASLSPEKMFGGAAGLAGLILFGFAFTFRRDVRVKGLFVLLLLTTSFMMTSCGGGNHSNRSATPTPATDEIASAVSGLASSTTYFWQVTATDANGNSVTSPVSSFTTQ